MGRIVVGVDGSDGSRRALRWAATEAAAKNARLEVVLAYERLPAALDSRLASGMSSEQIESLRREQDEVASHAATHAQAVVAKLVAELGDDAAELEITPLAIQSRRPARVLIERSTDADLLVVGSRGRGGFGGLLLGSTSQQCVTYANCPVVVMRRTRDAA